MAPDRGVAAVRGFGGAEVEAVARVVLGAGIGGEYFDGVVDAGDGEERFVGVA